MLTLFPDEQLITQSNDNAVTLTTHRICYEYKEWGRSYNQNIMLEHITSSENKYNTQIWLLIISILSFIGSLVCASGGNTEGFRVALFITLCCLALYWITRSNVIIIASPSTKMMIKATGMKREQVLEFINKVEQAKHKRLLNLNIRG